jgi:hypothetical protein
LSLAASLAVGPLIASCVERNREEEVLLAKDAEWRGEKKLFVMIVDASKSAYPAAGETPKDNDKRLEYQRQVFNSVNRIQSAILGENNFVLIAVCRDRYTQNQPRVIKATIIAQDTLKKLAEICQAHNEDTFGSGITAGLKEAKKIIDDKALGFGRVGVLYWTDGGLSNDSEGLEFPSALSQLYRLGQMRTIWFMGIKETSDNPKEVAAVKANFKDFTWAIESLKGEQDSCKKPQEKPKSPDMKNTKTKDKKQLATMTVKKLKEEKQLANLIKNCQAFRNTQKELDFLKSDQLSSKDFERVLTSFKAALNP